jgi:hypothetical protein
VVLGVEVVNVNVIRLTSSSELGSLEDLNPAKRMTVADIRSLRRKAHAQTKMQFSIARAIANAIAYLKNRVNEIVAQRNIDSICRSDNHCLKSEDHHYTAV